MIPMRGSKGEWTPDPGRSSKGDGPITGPFNAMASLAADDIPGSIPFLGDYPGNPVWP